MSESKRRACIIGGFCALGVILIVLLILIESMKKSPDMYTLVQNIALSILCSLIASAIFLYMQKGIEHDEKNLTEEKLDGVRTLINSKLNNIDKKLKRQEALYDAGIKSIRPKSYYDEKDDFWKKIIQYADSRMDLIGHSISPWLSNEYKSLFCEKIINMISVGKYVRIVLSCESGEFDKQKIRNVLGGKTGKKKLTKIESTCYELAKLIGGVDEAKREYLELYIAEREKVTYLYIRTDSQCFISPYILSLTNKRNSFLLELDTGVEYSRCFEEDFDEMIEHLDCIEWSDI